MNLVLTEPFEEDLRALPAPLQKRTLGKLALPKANLVNPSLRVKKMRGRKGIYEASVNMNYRLLFRVDGEDLILERVGPHKILDEA